MCTTGNDVTEKFVELLKHIETSSASAEIATDPQKLQGLKQKIESLDLENIENSKDYQAKCDVMDEI